MYDQIGTPDEAKRSEKEWNDRLIEIDEKLKSFTNLPVNQVCQIYYAK